MTNKIHNRHEDLELNYDPDIDPVCLSAEEWKARVHAVNAWSDSIEKPPFVEPPMAPPVTPMEPEIKPDEELSDEEWDLRHDPMIKAIQSVRQRRVLRGIGATIRRAKAR